MHVLACLSCGNCILLALIAQLFPYSRQGALALAQSTCIILTLASSTLATPCSGKAASTSAACTMLRSMRRHVHKEGGGGATSTIHKEALLTCKVSFVAWVPLPNHLPFLCLCLSLCNLPGTQSRRVPPLLWPHGNPDCPAAHASSPAGARHPACAGSECHGDALMGRGTQQHAVCTLDECLWHVTLGNSRRSRQLAATSNSRGLGL